MTPSKESVEISIGFPVLGPCDETCARKGGKDLCVVHRDIAEVLDAAKQEAEELIQRKERAAELSRNQRNDALKQLEELQKEHWLMEQVMSEAQEHLKWSNGRGGGYHSLSFEKALAELDAFRSNKKEDARDRRQE